MLTSNKFNEFTFQNSEECCSYFMKVEAILKSVASTYLNCGLETQSWCKDDELIIIPKFLNQLQNTMSAFKTKSCFDSGRSMKIDTTESGYPHFLEMMFLDTDIDCRNEQLLLLRPLDVLTNKMVEHIYEFKEGSKSLLEESFKRKYYDQLVAGELFLSKNNGDIIPLTKNTKTNRMQYLYSWAYFNSELNIPYVNILLFEDVNETKIFLQNGAQKLREQLKNEDNVKMSLINVAELIDQEIEVFPKFLKRIALGPIVNKYSYDESQLNILLKSVLNADKENDFIFSMTTEIVVSVAEELSKNNILPKTAYQKFFVQNENAENINRGTSSISKILFAPHSFVQKMYDSPLFQPLTKEHVIVPII